MLAVFVSLIVFFLVPVAIVLTRPLGKFGLSMVLFFPVVNIYYISGGIWYWLVRRQGEFFGESWAGREWDVFWFAVPVYCTLMVVLVGACSPKSEVLHIRGPQIPGASRKAEALWIANLISIVGAFASLYVIVNSSDVAAGISVRDVGSFFLLIGAVADVQIGAVLFGVAVKGGVRWWLHLFYYLIYAGYVGFRIKILLILTPLIMLYLLKDFSIRRIFSVGVGVLILIISLSLLTLVRVKYSGVDFSTLNNNDLDGFLYGFFAETNIIFGLLSVLDVFGRDGLYAGLSPIMDIFTQWIPRFFWSDKQNGAHLLLIAEGLSNDPAILFVGVSQPFYAEYYAIAGWLGVFIGLFLFLFVVIYIHRYIFRCAAIGENGLLVGVGLLMVFMFYFYFGRGVMASAVKTGVFTLGVYMFLVRSAVR